jgi:putative restriction endonuclease
MNPPEQAPRPDTVLEAFRRLRVYEHPEDGKRAVNKPLLLLLALGYAQREGKRVLSYVEIEDKLVDLLEEFGPHRATYSASYPFWYLQNDDGGSLWRIEDKSGIGSPTGERFKPSPATLRRLNLQAGLAPEVFDALVADPALLKQAARELLALHFPETLQADIAAAVGLNLEVASLGTGTRDPKFRTQVLNAYDHCCAICGFDARLGGKNVGLEAAHIRWVQMRGSNEVANGMAMCSLHHKLFDSGAITIEANGKSYQVLFSAELSGGSDAVRNWLLRSHRATLEKLPVNTANRPHPDNLRWHNEEVFKGPAL